MGNTRVLRRRAISWRWMLHTTSWSTWNSTARPSQWSPFQQHISKRAAAAFQLWAKTVNTSQVARPPPEGRSRLAKPRNARPQHQGGIHRWEEKIWNPCSVFPKETLQSIPQIDHLEQMAVELMNSCSWVHISWFLWGVFLVSVQSGEQQSRALLRRMQALPEGGMSSKPTGECEPVSDPEVTKVLVTKIGLPHNDLLTMRFLHECQEQFALPTLARANDEVFSATGLFTDFYRVMMAAAII